MSIFNLKKKSIKIYGLLAAILIPAIIFFAMFNAYYKGKNKATPKVNLVQVAIFADGGAGDYPFYEAQPDQTCVKQLYRPASSSAAASSTGAISLADKTSASSSSERTEVTAPVEPLVAAGLPTCRAHIAPPQDYQQLGKDGSVTLTLNLAADGRVTHGDIVTSSGFANLDDAALKHILDTWQFEPCKRGIEAVACQQTIKFRWAIN